MDFEKIFGRCQTIEEVKEQYIGIKRLYPYRRFPDECRRAYYKRFKEIKALRSKSEYA